LFRLDITIGLADLVELGQQVKKNHCTWKKLWSHSSSSVKRRQKTQVVLNSYDLIAQVVLKEDKKIQRL